MTYCIWLVKAIITESHIIKYCKTNISFLHTANKKSYILYLHSSSWSTLVSGFSICASLRILWSECSACPILSVLLDSSLVVFSSVWNMASSKVVPVITVTIGYAEELVPISSYCVYHDLYKKKYYLYCHRSMCVFWDSTNLLV